MSVRQVDRVDAKSITSIDTGAERFEDAPSGVSSFGASLIVAQPILAGSSG